MMRQYPAYKDSGFGWLGQIPSHWKTQRVKYLFREIDERSKHGEETLLSVSQYTGVTIRGSDNNSRESESLEGYKVCHPDDFVSNIMLAWMGAFGVTSHHGIVSPAYCVYRLKGDHNPKYFDYLFHTARYLAEFARNSTGIISSRWRLYTDDFFRIFSLLPPCEEQDAIVAFLEEQTAVINQFLTNKRRLIELLEEQKQVVINTAVTQGLDPTAPRKPSGIDWLGDIPAHWELKRLGWITSEINDINHEMPIGVEDGVPFLSAKDLLDDGTLNFEHDVKMISEEDFERLSKKIRPRRGDIIYSRIGARLGKARIVNTDVKFLISYSCCAVRVIPQKAIAEYVQLIMDSDFVLTEAKLRTVGVGVPDLGLKQITRFPIPLPPLDEQAEIVEFLKTKLTSIRQAIERTQREIELIEEYRKTLIAHAITGKIDVRSGV